MRAVGPTRRNSALLIVLLSVQLLLMSGSVRSANGSTLLESFVMRTTSPVVWLANRAGGGVRGAIRGIRETWVARAENRHLREEVLELRARIDRLEEDALEAERLRRVLGVREELAPESVVARVIARGETGQSRVLVVDRGTDAGIEIDDPVIAWGGAVGRVLYADRRYAKILVLSDPNCGVAAMVQRSRAQGMAFGQGDGPLEMSYVSRYQDVAVGDRVITSGADGVFPPGLTLGRITYLDAVEQVSMTIRIQPAVDFRALEEVVVLVGREVSRHLAPPEPEEER